MWAGRGARSLTAMSSASVFNLNNPAHVVHWHFFQMSVANVVVIVLTVVVFVVALLAPFPGHSRSGSES